MIKNYLKLEFTKSIKVLCKSLFSIIIMLLLLTATFVAVSLVIKEDSIVNKIKVAVVIPDNDNATKMATRYISKMDSVETIADFEYLNKLSAFEGLKEDNIQVVINLPEKFFEDVNNGKNTPMEVYVNEGANRLTKSFAILISSAVNDVRVTEAVVYAFISASYDGNEIILNNANIGDYIAMGLAKMILKRQSSFESVIVSEFGEIDAIQYYGFAILIIIMFLMGLNFAYLYKKEQIAFSEKLRVYGVNTVYQAIIKTIVMTTYTFIVGFIVYVFSGFIANRLGLYLWSANLSAIISLILISICTSAIFHAIYSLADNEYIASVFVVLTLSVLFICSGIIIPFTKMPSIVNYISYISPIRYVGEIGINGLFFNLHIKQYIEFIIVVVIMELVGVLGLCRRY